MQPVTERPPCRCGTERGTTSYLAGEDGVGGAGCGWSAAAGCRTGYSCRKSG